MKNALLLGRLCLAAIIGLAVSASGEITPRLLNYQGLLTDANGVPLSDQTITITFRIWHDSESSDPQFLKWEETRTVDLANGLFNVILGEFVPIDETVFSSAESYLGITLPGEPESVPRTRLVSVGYSSRVETVNGARGGVISGSVGVEPPTLKSGAASENVRFELFDQNGDVRFWADEDQVFTPCVFFADDSTIQCTAAMNGGAAQNERTVPPLSVSTGLTEILQETVYCPTDGFVLAIASGEVSVNHSGGANSVIQFGVSDQLDVLPADQMKRWVVPGNSPTAVYGNVVSANKVFAASQGENTFYCLASTVAGGSSFTAVKATLTLVFIPKAYGSISGTESELLSEATEAGGQPAVKQNHNHVRAGSETAKELDRQASEIAILRTQIAELRAMLEQRVSSEK